MGGQTSKENGKKGGRPPGSYSAKTLDRMKVAERIRQRTLGVADILFESQLSLAKGAQYLFRIDKEWVKTGESAKGERGFWRNKKPVMVSDPEEMRQYLEDEFCNGDAEDEYDPSAAYYFLVDRDPQNNAIDSMQDRTYGRAPAVLDVNLKLPQPIYSGKSQLTEGKKKLKTKAVVVHEEGKEPVTEQHDI